MSAEKLKDDYFKIDVEAHVAAPLVDVNYFPDVKRYREGSSGPAPGRIWHAGTPRLGKAGKANEILLERLGSRDLPYRGGRATGDG